MGMKSLKCMYFSSNSNVHYRGEELARDRISSRLRSLAQFATIADVVSMGFKGGMRSTHMCTYAGRAA